MEVLKQCLAIGVAGFFGALARFFVGRGFQKLVERRILETSFPVGTMVVNLSGCFILGFFGTFVVGRTSVSDTMKLAIGVGFVGAYTTFSTLMFDSNDLVEHGAVLQAAANIVFSILLGLVTVRLGAICARQF